MVCHNFPDSVPFPGEECQHSKASSKGISDLSVIDCSVLIATFNDSLRDRLYFKHDPKLIGMFLVELLHSAVLISVQLTCADCVCLLSLGPCPHLTHCMCSPRDCLQTVQ